MESPTAKMSQMRCSNPECRSTDIDLNESSGEAVCVRCGTVCEESTIVTAEGTEGYLADRRRDPWGGRPPPPPFFFGVGDTGGKDSPVESIHDAASRGDVEAVRRLLASGASPNSFCEAPDSFRERPESFYFGVDPQGETPILALCKVRRFTDGCAACLELLRDAGADLEATDGYGLTPLHYAARRGDTKMVSLLVDAGVDVDAKTLDQETALHYAARRGDTKIVSLLVDAGVDVDAKTPDEETALYLAVYHRATSCVEVLLAAGASLNLREGHGLTPSLHYAARRGNTKIVSLLVEAGLDVDAKTPDEETALYLAVYHRATSCVEVLLAAGASPNLREGHRLTPFDLALRREYHRMWPLFLRAGAELPAAYPPDPYLGRVVAAGGFKRYAQAHLARIRPTFASMLRLPAQPARRVAEFWLHAGYY